jgi:hypothetical protein
VTTTQAVDLLCAVSLRLQLCGRETIVHMTDDEENQPPEHQEAQSQPPVAQPRQADNEPKTPETAQPSKRESRFSILTALISAIAALLGALIGGIASYMVAQSNNTAQAEVEQVKTRQKTYADLITYQSDLLVSDNDVAYHYQFNPGDSDERDKVVNAQGENYEKWLHTDFIVRVVESSPKVDSARKAIYDHNLKIRNLIGDLVDHHNPTNEATTNALESEYEGMTGLLGDFTKAAKDDVTPAKRRGLHWSYSW